MVRIHRRLTLAAALALALTACAQTDTADETTEPAEPTEAATESAEPTTTPEAEATESAEAAASDDPAREAAMTVEELITEPETFLGEEIYVTGTIGEELEDEHAFTIPTIEETDELLVVNEGDVVLQELDSGDLVMVQGTLVEFDAEAMSDAGAELAPDDEALADFEGEHVLVASSVEQTDEQ